ncbi:recombinase family protein [Sphingomonas sp. GC_Shp_3]|uniref:recombinase family protein n=1 Tax=Sphingomonas sp. GC_Shp_3 TaxID=2937383 RepID=UPI0022698FD4|nr:recombinase family protein [Sphingomonas sp. GC_Shp_3]
MSRPLRAYGYVRVSNDDEDGNNASIAAQIGAIRERARRDGVEMIEMFEELNVSGRKLQRRQFDAMLADAISPERPVDIIYVYALSRFARRLLTQVTSEYKLEQAGVRLISLTEEFGDDANGRLMRSMIGVMNEKYALDASIFTRRDRRGNAQAGYFNGGPVPFGYQARTVAVEGRKERRKLFIVEEEAAVVRLIYGLARNGLHGTPMGTRAIAEHLNALGYRNRGREFFYSSVDGILTRQHYGGKYLDRTADSKGRTPSIEESIVIPCPEIVSPQIIAEVAARRARAAPKVTPPRVTNGPTLLTGILRCNALGCGAGMTIRTGKSGQYIYYACNAKLTGGAGRCETRAIRQDELDSIVLSVLTDRILERDRLLKLLQAVLEKSDLADAQRHEDLNRVRREKVAAETRIRRLLEMLEEGLMSPRDPLFAERLAQHRQNVVQLEASERSLNLQLERGPQRISEETIVKFGKLICEQLKGGNSALRKAYVKLLIDSISVDNHAIHIQGSTAALESAVIRSGDAAMTMVPGFNRKWCATQS